MTHDWLLVETLGSRARRGRAGRCTKNLVPISAFLRRNPHLMAIQTAIGETVRAGQALSSITPKNDRVIRTEVVQMTDGRIHGVHVWIGPPGMEPPERLVPGPLKWDLTGGVATDTPESLFNSGRDPSTEATHGRTFAEDLPIRVLNPSETKVLSMAIKPEPGMKLLQHVGRHRSPGRADHGRIRRPRRSRDAGRRQRAADLSSDELARRTRGAGVAADRPGTTHSQRPGTPRSASRAGRSRELDTAQVARRPARSTTGAPERPEGHRSIRTMLCIWQE